MDMIHKIKSINIVFQRHLILENYISLLIKVVLNKILKKNLLYLLFVKNKEGL